jgi:hypothetical protein
LGTTGTTQQISNNDSVGMFSSCNKQQQGNRITLSSSWIETSIIINNEQQNGNTINNIVLFVNMSNRIYYEQTKLNEQIVEIEDGIRKCRIKNYANGTICPFGNSTYFIIWFVVAMLSISSFVC